MDERKVIFSLTKPQDLSFDPDRSEEEAKQAVAELGGEW